MFVLFSLFWSFTFWATEAQEALANVTRKDSLPELREGEVCTPGSTYRVSCNTCRCGENKTLLCTKLACLNNESVDALLKFKRNHKSGNKNVLRSNKANDNPPFVPKAECIPGKIYKRGCNKCFCNEFKVALCSLMGCLRNETQRKAKDLIPDDVRPAFTALELDSLVALPHTAAPCITGKAYRVDCNTCLCMTNGNLLCDKMLCLNYDHYNNIEAVKLSGSKCDKDTTSFKCITCKCVNGKTKCEAEEGCISNMVPTTSLTGQKQKLLFQKKTRLGLAMDPHEDKCITGQIYKQNCNKCFCQEDGLMRCSQKKCLNHGEVVKLQRHKLFLAEHGE